MRSAASQDLKRVDRDLVVAVDRQTVAVQDQGPDRPLLQGLLKSRSDLVPLWVSE